MHAAQNPRAAARLAGDLLARGCTHPIARTRKDTAVEMSGRASKKAGMLASSRSRHRPNGGGSHQQRRVVTQESVAEDSTEGSTPGTPNSEAAAASPQSTRGAKVSAPSATTDCAAPASAAAVKDVVRKLPGEAMQLSYSVKGQAADGGNNSGERLPRYPVADTIALLLILINFPNLLVTISHLLFSYKEHLLPSSPGQAPPLAMVLFVDAVVLLLTVVLLPTFRHIITDISHIIIAISLSGSDWKLCLPFAVALTAIRTALSRLWQLALDPELSMGKGEWSERYVRGVRQVLRPLRALRPASSSTGQALEQVTSVVAVHVFTLGLVRLAHYWLQPTGTARKADSSGDKGASVNTTLGSNKTKKKSSTSVSLASSHTHTHATGSDAKEGTSIWDTVLQWRLELLDKRHDFATLSGSGNTGDLQVWVSEIASTFIVLGFSVAKDGLPLLELHVNGLLWSSKPSVNKVQGDRTICSLFIDNLSPKTEYDLSLQITTNPETEQQISVCTQPHPQQPVTRRRGDSSALPPIHTNLPTVAATTPPAQQAGGGGSTTTTSTSDDNNHHQSPLNAAATVATTTTNPTATHPNGPPSPISTLEDAIANAGAKVEERRSTLKRVRRENTKRLQALQKECDHLSSRVNAVDKNEHRLQGRILSLQNELRRMEAQTDDADAERETLKLQRDADHQLWLDRRSLRDSTAKRAREMQVAFEDARKAHESRYALAESEAAKARSKADKLSAKRTRIQQDLDKLGAQADQLLRIEYLQRCDDREKVQHRRLQIEADLLKSIHEMQQAIELGLTYG